MIPVKDRRGNLNPKDDTKTPEIPHLIAVAPFPPLESQQTTSVTDPKEKGTLFIPRTGHLTHSVKGSHRSNTQEQDYIRTTYQPPPLASATELNGNPPELQPSRDRHSEGDAQGG